MQGLSQGHMNVRSIIAALDLHWQRSLNECDVLANIGKAYDSDNHQLLLGIVPKGMLKTVEPVCFLFLNSFIRPPITQQAHALTHYASRACPRR